MDSPTNSSLYSTPVRGSFSVLLADLKTIEFCVDSVVRISELVNKIVSDSVSD